MTYATSTLTSPVDGTELLGSCYREDGVRDMTVTVYPQARHEIFSETNRDEVTRDVLAWLVQHTPAA